MEDVVLRSFDAGILTLTMNRPGQLNAMTWPMMGQLLKGLREAAADPAVRVVVLAGAGRGFCSGGDIHSGGGCVKGYSSAPSVHSRLGEIGRADAHSPPASGHAPRQQRFIVSLDSTQ